MLYFESESGVIYKVSRLEFRMFGKLTLSYDNGSNESDSIKERSVSDDDFVSAKMWSMLCYLACNKKRKVGFDEITDILWSNKPMADPANSLKALLFKARKVFDRLGVPDSKELLTYKSGAFSWSTECEISIDIDEFEKLSKKLMSDTNNITSENLRRLRSIYRGDFLPELQSQSWTISVNVYYHTQMVKTCSKCAEFLTGQRRFFEVAEFCSYALSIEPYDELLNRCLIESFVNNGQSDAALKHYRYVKSIFLDFLGEEPSSVITDTYKMIADALSPTSVNMEEIKSELIEATANGAFECEYMTFREIYRVASRNLARNNESPAVGTVIINNYYQMKCTPAKRNSETEILRDFIKVNLRIGDVLTKLGSDRFLILLGGTTSKNTESILKRLVKSFKRQYRNSRIDLVYTTLQKEKTKKAAINA